MFSGNFTQTFSHGGLIVEQNLNFLDFVEVLLMRSKYFILVHFVFFGSAFGISPSAPYCLVSLPDGHVLSAS